jgi:hypothetical protein
MKVINYLYFATKKFQFQAIFTLSKKAPLSLFAGVILTLSCNAEQDLRAGSKTNTYTLLNADGYKRSINVYFIPVDENGNQITDTQESQKYIKEIKAGIINSDGPQKYGNFKLRGIDNFTAPKMIFSNAESTESPVALRNDSIFAIFSPDHIKLSFAKSIMFNGNCAAPAETVKILRKKWKEYNPIDLGENKGNFLLNNDLGINMDADYDTKPNGKCVNLFWRVQMNEANPPLVSDIDGNPINTVQDLAVYGKTGRFGFRDIESKSIKAFAKSGAGLRIGVAEGAAGLLTDFRLMYNKQSERQILNLLAPTDSGLHATVHVKGVIKGENRYQYAINQGSGSPHKTGESPFSGMKWAFKHNLLSPPGKPNILTAESWMPLYTDLTKDTLNKKVTGTYHTAPFLQQKGEHFFDGRIKKYRLLPDDKFVKFVYEYEYAARKDITIDESIRDAHVKPYLWFSQRVPEKTNKDETGAGIDQAEVYMYYKNVDGSFDERKLTIHELDDPQQRLAAIDNLQCYGKGGGGSQCSEAIGWNCDCGQGETEKLQSIIFAYKMPDTEVWMGLKISASEIYNKDDPFISANFSVAKIPGYKKTLIRLRPRVLPEMKKGEIFSQKYIFKVGLLEDLKNDM